MNISYRFYLLSIIILLITPIGQSQIAFDDFEGNGTITTWYGDNCGAEPNVANPYTNGINTSSQVLKYTDTGGQYANVQFDMDQNFNIAQNFIFSITLYVPSSGITGSQNNQVSLKLQNKNLGQPWTTQSEIIKSISLDSWQTVQFNFLNDSYINLDGSSGAPTSRSDFNRVVIQFNGENNNDQVVAYIDDFYTSSSSGLGTSNYDQMVWNDEFSGNGAISSAHWHHQTVIPSIGSWYNGEVQHYTDRLDNSNVDNGYLHIIAKSEVFTDQGITKNHTSARLNSKYAFTYGKVDIKARLPEGAGTWPALWLLGKNITETGAYWQLQGFATTNWPACGEIDIMEHWGTNMNYVQSATHTPSSFGSTDNHGGRLVSDVSTQDHIYSLIWTAEKLDFLVDDVLHYSYNPSVKNASTWPFDNEMYLLFNFAVLPSISSSFVSDTLAVDYIRVYKETQTAGITASPIPSHNQTDDEVISIFSNAYNNISDSNFDPDWSQNTNASIMSLTGNAILKYDNLNYQGIQLGTSQDVSDHNFLHIDYYSQNSTDLGVYLISTGAVEKEYPINSILTNQWVSLDIPLSAFTGVDLADIIQLKIEGNGTVVFLDNIYFYKDSSLPITLKNFNAQQSQNENTLFWTIESEINGSHFIVQRSKDGTQFDEIGIVNINDIHTDFNGLMSYSFEDKNPYLDSYYRLQMVDLDGSYSFSDMQYVNRLDSESNLRVYPTLVQNEINISLSSLSEEVLNIELIDIKGTILRKDVYHCQMGNNHTTLHTYDLAAGIYFIRIETAMSSETIKIIKQ